MKFVTSLCLVLCGGISLCGEILPYAIPTTLPSTPILPQAQDAMVERVRSLEIVKGAYEYPQFYFSQDISRILQPSLPMLDVFHYAFPIVPNVQTFEGLNGSVELAANTPNIEGQKSTVQVVANTPNIEGQKSTVQVVANTPNIEGQKSTVQVVANTPNIERQTNSIELVSVSQKYYGLNNASPYGKSGNQFFGLSLIYGFNSPTTYQPLSDSVIPLRDDSFLPSPIGMDMWSDGPLGALRKKANKALQSGDIALYGEYADQYLKGIEDAIKRRSNFSGNR